MREIILCDGGTVGIATRDEDQSEERVFIVLSSEGEEVAWLVMTTYDACVIIQHLLDAVRDVTANKERIFIQ